MKIITFLVGIISVLIITFNNFTQLVLFTNTTERLIGFLGYSMLFIWYLVMNKKDMLKIFK